MVQNLHIMTSSFESQIPKELLKEVAVRKIHISTLVDEIKELENSLPFILQRRRPEKAAAMQQEIKDLWEDVIESNNGLVNVLIKISVHTDVKISDFIAEQGLKNLADKLGKTKEFQQRH